MWIRYTDMGHMQIAIQIEPLHVYMLYRYMSHADCYTYMCYTDMLHRYKSHVDCYTYISVIQICYTDICCMQTAIHI